MTDDQHFTVRFNDGDETWTEEGGATTFSDGDHVGTAAITVQPPDHRAEELEPLPVHVDRLDRHQRVQPG
jgi:hypothetical protein